MAEQASAASNVVTEYAVPVMRAITHNFRRGHFEKVSVSAVNIDQSYVLVDAADGSQARARYTSSIPTDGEVFWAYWTEDGEYMLENPV